MSNPIVDLTTSKPSATRVAPNLSAKRVLESAIHDATPARLRTTLEAICDSSTEESRIAHNILLVLEDRARRDSAEGTRCPNSYKELYKNGKDQDEQDDVRDLRVVASSVSKDPKRLQPRLATCRNCSDEFEVTNMGRTGLHMASWYAAFVYSPILD